MFNCFKNMDSPKKEGVMAALKGRKGFGSKKGVALLGIVQKLSAKRKALKDGKKDSGAKC